MAYEAPARQPTAVYAPATFQERGVAVPFTTPQLAGARVRTGARGRLELVVANPSGGRGMYILPWLGLTALCTPSLHDRRLYAAIDALAGADPGAITPAGIRDAAAAVAAEGLAGRAAAAAAAAAATAASAARLQAHHQLLLTLTRQVAPERLADHRPTEGDAQAVAAVAPRLGVAAPLLTEFLEQLARCYAPLGVGSEGPACIPALLARMAACRKAMAAATPSACEADRADATLVAGAAALTLYCARGTTEGLLGRLEDMQALLGEWADGAAALQARLSRPDWLLDGWEHICLVWEATSDPGVFSELADLVPALPREAGTWVDSAEEMAAGATRQGRRVKPGADGQAVTSMQELLHRNERLLTMALERAA